MPNVSQSLGCKRDASWRWPIQETSGKYYCTCTCQRVLYLRLSSSHPSSRSPHVLCGIQGEVVHTIRINWTDVKHGQIISSLVLAPLTGSTPARLLATPRQVFLNDIFIPSWADPEYTIPALPYRTEPALYTRF